MDVETEGTPAESVERAVGEPARGRYGITVGKSGWHNTKSAAPAAMPGP
jgi:hypothetical protein